MEKPAFGGGWQAVRYTFKIAQQVGPADLFRAMTSKNACKTCALGMGGQQGGMRNEAAHFPEFCKKSLQAMASDMQGRIAPEFFQRFSIPQMQSFSPREMETLGRLAFPILTAPGDSHYRPVSWESAIDTVARKLHSTDPRRVFFYASGRSSNEAGFLLQLFARVYGTNHVNNCSYYCHQASSAGLLDSVGVATATVSLDDLEHADTFFLIGGNPASNHPRLMSTLVRLRRRGGNVIVINPVKEAGLVNFRVPSDPRSMLLGDAVASHYLQVKIGGDIALMTGLAKSIIESGAADHSFIASHTADYRALDQLVRATDWPTIEHESGVPRQQIHAVAAVYAASRSTIFGWTMGITHHQHGVSNVQWIVNLALLRGMIARPGAGLLPIRGHSNVQGMGTMNVAPAVRKAVLQRLDAIGVKTPDFPGFDTMSCMDAALRGELSVGLCLGGNLYGSNPDSARAREALANLDLVVYLSTTLNTGHASGLGKQTVVLPVLARDEEPRPTTQESMFSFVRLSDGGPTRHPGLRSETSILAQIARQTLGDQGPVDWRAAADTQHVRELISRIVPGMESLKDIEQTKQEFHIPGRNLGASPAAGFSTPNHLARFRPHPIPSLAPLEPDQLRLMTVRSEGQFNTVVYEEEDLYRGQERRDVILINPVDLSRLKLTENQSVNVSNPTGTLRALARPFDIAPGCALMYYPEANVLVPRGVDPLSKTPAFKNVIVRIQPA